MKIFFDHQAFSIQNFGGISRYYTEIIKNNKNYFDFELYAPFSNNFYLKKSDIKTRSFLKGKNFKGKKHILKLINNLKTKKHLKKTNFDIFHPTYYDPYFLNKIGKKPFVCTVHDFTHEYYPGSFDRFDKTKDWKKILIKKANHIIAVSRNTKNDILKFFNIPENKISVIYHGFYSENFNKEEKIPVPGKYLLYVGSRNTYKNFNVLLDVLSLLKKEYNDLNLICVGGGKFNDFELKKSKSLNIVKNTFQVNPNDNQLSFLYKNAIGLVYPSKYEGFGIPILEAFSKKCPVVLSERSSLPEIAGDAGLYFNPENIDDIKEKIEKIISSENVRKNLINKGLERLHFFSWQKASKQTAEVYKKVL